MSKKNGDNLAQKRPQIIAALAGKKNAHFFTIIVFLANILWVSDKTDSVMPIVKKIQFDAKDCKQNTDMLKNKRVTERFYSKTANFEWPFSRT